MTPEERATVGSYPTTKQVSNAIRNWCGGAEQAWQHTQKYDEGETVDLKIKVNGVWGTAYGLTVGVAKLGPNNKPEYQLKKADGTMYDQGKYFKEADLKAA